MTIEIKGTIKSVGAIERPTETFSKRDITIIIDEDSQYPQPISVQAIQDNCEKVDELRVGDNATLTCNLRGNEYKDKVYISLQLWKFQINKTSAGGIQPSTSFADLDGTSDGMPF